MKKNMHDRRINICHELKIIVLIKLWLDQKVNRELTLCGLREFKVSNATSMIQSAAIALRLLSFMMYLGSYTTCASLQRLCVPSYSIDSKCHIKAASI